MVFTFNTSSERSRDSRYCTFGESLILKKLHSVEIDQKRYKLRQTCGFFDVSIRCFGRNWPKRSARSVPSDFEHSARKRRWVIMIISSIGRYRTENNSDESYNTMAKTNSNHGGQRDHPSIGNPTE